MISFKRVGDQPGRGLRVVVVGGGPAGYVAAIRSAQLGAGVTLVERKQIGGAFLNSACLPGRTIAAAARTMRAVKRGRRLGVEVKEARFDLASARRTWQEASRASVANVLGILHSAGVQLLAGSASFTPDGRLAVALAGGSKREVPYDRLIIAVGATCAIPDIPGADDERSVRITDLLSSETLPAKLIIVGGGMEACSAACWYAALGSEVTLVAPDSALLPDEDEDVSRALAAAIVGQGVALYTETEPIEVVSNGRGVSLRTRAPDSLMEIDANLIAFGDKRNPNLSDIDAAAVGLVEENGRLIVDPGMQTNLPGVYAAGDCNGGLMLAHAASAEGEVAAENACGGTRALGYRTVPRCAMTFPEVAAVGLTERAARKRDIAVHTASFPFSATPRALAEGEDEGFVKIVADASYGSILGIHMMGPSACDMISEAALAVRKGLLVSDLVDVVHASGTFPEALREAALALSGRPIHARPIPFV